MILAGNAQQFLHTLSNSFTLSCLLWLPCLKTSLTLTCQRATSSSKPFLASHAKAVPGNWSPFYSVFYLDVWYHPSVTWAGALSCFSLFSELISSVQSVQSLSRIRLFATPWITARQASLSITNSQSSLKLMSIESVMPSSHLVLCRPLLLLLSIFPSIRVFSNESTLRMRWPKY